MTLLRLCTLSGVSAVAFAGGLVWSRRPRKSPEQREALRRQRLGQGGRITDGTLLDVCEIASAGGRSAQLVVYSYGVSGVVYQCAQDVTALLPSLDLSTCCMGDAANVKYDPRHPGDSIVAAESWCGLRFGKPVSSASHLPVAARVV